jgi:ABC-type amino acid transport substrate-binding protein
MRLPRSVASTMVIAAFFATCFTTCVSASDAAPSALAAIKARGKLVMLCFPHQDNPFIKVNLAQGPMKKAGTTADFKGIDVDLMSAFARSLGVQLEVRPTSTPGYAQLIPELLAGSGDVIASSFSGTPERAQQVDLSDPYFEVYQVVLVHKDSKIKGPDDLVGKTAAIVPGAVMEATIREFGIPPERIHHQGFTRDVLLEVLNKEADFTVTELDDYGTRTPLLKEFKDLRVAFHVGKSEPYVFAVPKGSDLLGALNGFIAKVRASGELAATIKRNIIAYK